MRPWAVVCKQSLSTKGAKTLWSPGGRSSTKQNLLSCFLKSCSSLQGTTWYIVKSINSEKKIAVKIIISLGEIGQLLFGRAGGLILELEIELQFISPERVKLCQIMSIS